VFLRRRGGFKQALQETDRIIVELLWQPFDKLTQALLLSHVSF